MGTKVKELKQPSMTGAVCNPCIGGCCSMHRKKGRVYHDQLWKWSLEHPGEKPFR